MSYFTLSNGEKLYFEDSDHMLVSNYPDQFAEEVGKLLD